METKIDMRYETEAMMQQRIVEGVEEKKMKVIIAIDESDGSFYALKWVLENLLISTGAITLLHVQQPIQQYIFPAGPAIYATSTVIDSVRTAQEQNSAMLLARALQICEERMIKANSVILKGDPKEMICEAVEQIQADLLVVGSRGLSKIKRTFLGSVSDYCAHHAKCPILIVKPPKGHRSEGSKEK